MLAVTLLFKKIKNQRFILILTLNNMWLKIQNLVTKLLFLNIYSMFSLIAD